MPEPNTHWNVRISPNATVKDVCDKLAKKIDEKYPLCTLTLRPHKSCSMTNLDILLYSYTLWEKRKRKVRELEIPALCATLTCCFRCTSRS